MSYSLHEENVAQETIIDLECFDLKLDSKNDEGCCLFMVTWQVCWKCLASKGTDDVSMAYTDVNQMAAWRQTIGLAGDPWSEHRAFCDIGPWQAQSHFSVSCKYVLTVFLVSFKNEMLCLVRV